MNFHRLQLEEIENVVQHSLSVRRVQVSPAEMHAGVRVRAVLPAGPAPEIRQRPPGLRRQQRCQDPERAQHRPPRGRRDVTGVRGRGSSPGPGVRLRWVYLDPPEQAQAAPDGSLQCQEGSLDLHRPSGADDPSFPWVAPVGDEWRCNVCPHVGSPNWPTAGRTCWGAVGDSGSATAAAAADVRGSAAGDGEVQCQWDGQRKWV